MRRPDPSRSQGRGVALVLVLWMVAALTVAVSGLMYMARGEIRVAGVERDSIVASARADAAIRLVLQQMSAQGEPVRALTTVAIPFDGVSIEVRVIPLTGLIDLNRAPESLLTDLVEVAGELPRAAATQVAQAIVARRQPGGTRVAGPSGSPIRLYAATEDLLQVPGIDYALYARLAPLVTTDAAGSGRVNPLAAPVPVLRVLAAGDAQAAQQLALQRDGAGLLTDTTRLNAAHIDQATSSRYRIEARLPLAGGATLVRAHVVQLGLVREEGLPWRVFHTQRTLEAPIARPDNA